MDVVEQRVDRLLQHLARENRQLLAMLRLGYSLRRAERILGEGSGKAHAGAGRKSISRGAAEGAEE